MAVSAPPVAWHNNLLTQLLNTVREGKLTAADLAYVRAGFFPDTANTDRNELKKLGTPTRVQLLKRSEREDDRLYLYELTFPGGMRYLRVGLAPDNQVSSFSINPQP